MASKIDKQAYSEMISALQTFATAIGNIADGLQATSEACKGALEEDDAAIPELCDKVTKAGQKYSECAGTARSIAATMQEELDRAIEEERTWASTGE